MFYTGKNMQLNVTAITWKERYDSDFYIIHSDPASKLMSKVLFVVFPRRKGPVCQASLPQSEENAIRQNTDIPK